MYLTIKEFAEKNGVTPQAVQYQIAIGNIKTITKYGRMLINGAKIYEPIRGRGGKGKKKTTNKRRRSH